MNAISLTPDHVGVFVWVLWGLTGLLEGLLTARAVNRRPWVDCLGAIPLAIAGGYFASHFVGDTPTMRLIISLLGAAFASAIWLYIAPKKKY